MNKTELVVLRILQGWSLVLGAIVISALVYAAVQMCTGNYHGTASFEF